MNHATRPPLLNAPAASHASHQVYLTGTSAGGMMLENLLCSSALISKRVAAAVDIIGGIGRPMLTQCKPPGGRRVPFRILHGENDQVLHWDTATDVDGAPFLSTSERLGFQSVGV